MTRRLSRASGVARSAPHSSQWVDSESLLSFKVTPGPEAVCLQPAVGQRGRGSRAQGSLAVGMLGLCARRAKASN